MKSRLYDRLIDGLSDMQVIGLDPSVSKKSSERILKKVAELDKDFDQIIYRIISTGCQRYTCTSLLPEIANGATNDTSEDANDIPNDTCFNTEHSDDTICSTANNTTECVNQIKDDNTAIGAFADKDSSADDLIIGANGDQPQGRLETEDIILNLDSSPVSCQPSDSQLTTDLDSNTISCQPSDSQLTTEKTITFNNTYVQPKEVQHETSFLARMKGKKIKQKVCHIENIAFGWVRSNPWSLKKRWGFYCPEDVTCVQ